MAKRRTSGIQRRSRASEEALTRRLDGGGLRLDWRILLIGGMLVAALVVGVVAVLAAGQGGGPTPNQGTPVADDGGGHVRDGTTYSTAERPYSSTPATSGPHWDAPNNWGVYATPQREEQLIHNLEHGGIVIWYQPDQLDEAGISQLESYVNTEVRGTRYKVILSPWDGEDFEAPIAVTAWRRILYLEEADTGAIREFTNANYGNAPEPMGGPGPPGG